MTHKEWNERINDISDMSDAGVAAESLRQLGDVCRQELKDAIGFWHLGQTLQLCADRLLEAGRPVEACDLFEALAKEYKTLLVEYSRSRADLLSTLAVHRFSLGEHEKGEMSIKEALDIYGRLPEPSIALIDALTAWRQSLDRRGKSPV